MLREIILHQQDITYLATYIVMKEKPLVGIGHPTVPFLCQLPWCGFGPIPLVNLAHNGPFFCMAIRTHLGKGPKKIKK